MDSASEPLRLPGGITRSELERDGLRTALRERHPEVPTIGDRQMRAAVTSMLAARPLQAAGEGVWVFGYGSLLWNPCVAIAERRGARLYGFHRDFRIKLAHGRGSPEAPGLMLGLVPGGSCRGVALRVRADDLEYELLMIWRREMLTGVYVPRWVELHIPGERLRAITFVANPRHPSYCPRLDEACAVELLATGTGMLGSAADYLNNTVACLDAQGIHDRRLRVLRDRVAARLAPGGSGFHDRGS